VEGAGQDAAKPVIPAASPQPTTGLGSDAAAVTAKAKSQASTQKANAGMSGSEAAPAPVETTGHINPGNSGSTAGDIMAKPANTVQKPPDTVAAALAKPPAPGSSTPPAPGEGANETDIQPDQTNAPSPTAPQGYGANTGDV